MELAPYIHIEVIDSKNNDVVKSLNFKGESLLGVYFYYLAAMLFTPYNGTIHQFQVKDITGTIRTFPLNDRFNITALCSYQTAINEGIVIGSNNAANTVDQHKLNSIISSGIVHYSLEKSTAVEGNTYKAILKRKFIVSASSINVNEVGIYAKAQDAPGNACLFCIARDVLPETISLVTDQIISITYTIQLTV